MAGAVTRGVIALAFLGSGCSFLFSGSSEAPVDAGPLDDAPTTTSFEFAFEWQVGLGGAETVISVDRSNRMVAAVTFDEPLSLFGQSLTPQGTDLVLARFLPEGGEDLIVPMGDVGDERVSEITTEAAQGIIVAGTVDGQGNIGGMAVTANETFVAQFDQAGALSWLAMFFSDTPYRPRSLATDSNTVIVGGEYTSNLQLRGPLIGANPIVQFPDADGVDGFYAELLSDGGSGLDGEQRTFSSEQMSGAREVVWETLIDNLGNTIVVGTFDDSVVLDGAVNSLGVTDLFVAHLNADNEVSWSVVAHSARVDVAFADTDAVGNIVVALAFDGTIQVRERIFQSEQTDILLFMLDNEGDLRWAERYGGPGNDRPGGVAVSPNGRVVLTGEYSGPADFGGDPLPIVDGPGAFLAAYGPTGANLAAASFDGGGPDTGLDVRLDGRGGVYLVASHTGAIDFGGDTLLPTASGPNQALVKFNLEQDD